MADEFSDCERRDSGWLDQDVNAWTSLAYVVVGLVIAREVRWGRLSRVMAAFALVAVLEGVGSFLYHGADGEVAQALHDIPLVGIVAFIAGWHLGRLFGAADRGAFIALVCAIVIGTTLFVVETASASALVALAIAAIVGAELIARARRLVPVWTAPIVTISLVAAGFWLAGTPTSPACDPGSLAQPHGVWHLSTALVALAWVDRAGAAARPDHPPQMLRRATDRILGLLAIVLTHAFHRSIDVIGRDRFPTGRPVLVVANHGNGFVDPIVVTAALRRLPRFLAKAALWKVTIARPFLALAGVLPVHRSADGDRPDDNRSVFEACHHDLARGSTVAIFPEGTTGDRANLDRVRSGAARIALGALPTAPGLMIVPIGLAFESRVETRSRSVVMFGDPIDVAVHHRAPVGAHDGSVHTDSGGPDGRSIVAELTRVIGDALVAVSPQFDSVDEREILRASARVERNDAARPGIARFGDIETAARRLAAGDDTGRARVIECYRTYATRLALVGLDDRQVDRSPIAWRRLLVSAAAIALGGPFLVAVTLIHLPALLAVVIGTGLVRSTATKGTVRVLVGLVTGLLTWIVTGVVIADGWSAIVAAAAVAAGGAVALLVWPPISREVQAINGRLIARDRGSLMEAVHADRGALIAAVRDASMAG